MLDSMRNILPGGMIPNFVLVQQNNQNEELDVLEQHFNRQSVLDIILKVELEEQTMFKQGQDLNIEVNGVLKAFLPKNMVLAILDKMKEDIDNQEVIDMMQKNWLVKFEQKEYETVFVHWYDELQEKCKAIIMNECDFIRKRSEAINKDRLRSLQPIVDPKLKEEERIQEITLRVYNKNPDVYIKISLEDFILEVVNQLETVHNDLFGLKNSDEVAQFKRPIDESQTPEAIPPN